MEITAPAGSMAALQAALQAGADSVYLGLKGLNMRARSGNNFSPAQLAEAVALARSAGVKTYLTLNIIFYNKETEKIKEIINKAARSGIDAVIASDIAVIQYCRQCRIPVHISTQLSVANYEAVKFWAQYADVIVLARELDLGMIKDITARIKKDDLRGPSGELLKIEIFAHGALCISAGGRCGMSLYQYNASANRGLCLQSCRFKYRVINEETGQEMRLQNGYLFSAQDICTIDILDRIKKAGVSVLKIEGRGRDALYVKKTVAVYKAAVEALRQNGYTAARVSEWLEELKTVFNRGLEGGYYLGNKCTNLANRYGSHAVEKKIFSGKVVHFYSKLKVVEISITATPVKEGEKFVITGDTTGVLSGKIKNLRGDGCKQQTVKQGQRATFTVSRKVRINDRLYIIRKREKWKDL
ncbi:MAG TPA: peptidase U32 family protein [Spirochaetota bacterium]|nr:peptidase U32 family protein [Spirochaetota bacterium]